MTKNTETILPSIEQPNLWRSDSSLRTSSIECVCSVWCSRFWGLQQTEPFDYHCGNMCVSFCRRCCHWSAADLRLHTQAHAQRPTRLPTGTGDMTVNTVYYKSLGTPLTNSVRTATWYAAPGIQPRVYSPLCTSALKRQNSIGNSPRISNVKAK